MLQKDQLGITAISREALVLNVNIMFEGQQNRSVAKGLFLLVKAGLGLKC